MSSRLTPFPSTIKFLSTFLTSPDPQSSSQQVQISLNSHPAISIPFKTAKLTTYKGQNGRVLLFGGSEQFTGAPYFATKAAINVGSDLIQIICERTAVHSLRGLNPDIMCHGALPSVRLFGKSPFWVDFQQKVLEIDQSNPTSALNSKNTPEHLTTTEVQPSSQHYTLSMGKLTPGFPQNPSILWSNFITFLKQFPPPGLLSRYLSNIPVNLTHDDPLFLYLYHCFAQIIKTVNIQPKSSPHNSSPPPSLPHTALSYTPVNDINSITSCYAAGPGLGSDPMTLSVLSYVIPAIIHTNPYSCLVLDANALSLFHSSSFLHSIINRPKCIGRRVTCPNNKTTTKSAEKVHYWNNTTLTPNKRELAVLYETLCGLYTEYHEHTKRHPSGNPAKETQQCENESNNNGVFSWVSKDGVISVLGLPAPPKTSVLENKSPGNSNYHPLQDVCWDNLFTTTQDHQNNQNSQNPQTTPSSSSSPKYSPPNITSDHNTNMAIAIARFCGNITVYVKGEAEVITDGVVVLSTSLPMTSPRRCGGQGDITTGIIAGMSKRVISTLSSLYGRDIILHGDNGDIVPPKSPPNEDIIKKFIDFFHNSGTLSKDSSSAIEDDKDIQHSTIISAISTPTLLSALFSSIVLKSAALETFQQHYTGTTADKIIDQLPPLLLHFLTPDTTSKIKTFLMMD
jgi:NAD(P)H-hydrate repair Nnr-like enzyme with NAD(P)H-hydrate dehydratase domain